MTLRDIKKRARQDLHLAMRVLAYCYHPVTGWPEQIHVRVHSKIDALGDVKGTSFGYAEKIETIPRLVYERAEHEPVKHEVVVISPEEGYRVAVIETPDFITRKAQVTVLTAGDLARYMSPEDGLPLFGSAMLPRLIAGGPRSSLPRLTGSGEADVLIPMFGEATLPRIG